MFFILSKVIYWLIMPTSMITIILGLSLFLKSSQVKRHLRIIGISALIFFSNPLIAKWAINLWEPDAISYASIDEPYDWCVVLGGFTAPNRPPYDRIHFNKGADRIAHAIDLYKLGKVKNIIISGGSGVMTFEGKSESTAIHQFALTAGIAAEHIAVDDQSRNTRENAINCKKLLKTNDRVLLITSAFHMPRASRSFEKVGIHHTTFPTDYYGGPIRLTPEDILVPSLAAIKNWHILIKEWVGYAAYRVIGYI